METIEFSFPAEKQIERSAHVGVVGSGDLEIMMEPSNDTNSNVIIRTGITGYKHIWEPVIQRFFSQHEIAMKVRINDFGATPGVVKLRLEQALEVINDD